MRTILGGVLGKIPIPSPAMLVALSALLIAASGTAVAAISFTDANGTIKGCVDNKTGSLRVLQSGQSSCRSTETQLAWKDGSTLLGKNDKAADSDKLDGQDSTAFLGVNGKASDSDNLDGQDSTAFLGANQKASDAAHADRADYADNAGVASDSSHLQGRTPEDFYAAGSTVANSYALDGRSASAFLGRNEKASDSYHADRADTATNAQNAANADTLDGKDSTAFVLASNQQFTKVGAFDSQIDQTAYADAQQWRFIGAPLTLTVQDADRITVSAEATLGRISGDPTRLGYAFCYQDPIRGQNVAFSGTHFSVAEVSTTRVPFAVSETRRFSGGTYTVGFCVTTNGTTSGTVNLDDSGSVNGWVMVANN